MSGIYLHIPFCKQACHYCDFHFSTSRKHKDGVLSAMYTELEQRAPQWVGPKVETVYFGGGTPSLLSAEEISGFIDRIDRLFDLDAEAEITLEANPDDLHPDKIRQFATSPVNRLSVGIQSFHERELKWMNRAHSQQEALESLQALQEVFENYSIDLIYGIPGSDPEDWEATLETALEFNPPHISAYALTVEPGTALQHMIDRGKSPAADDLRAESDFRVLLDRLEAEGYQHYEISNFGKPGFLSRNNSAYWKGLPYLGIGPSAHSFDGRNRRWNVAHNIKYLRALEEGLPYFETEALSKRDRYNEAVMTGLRTMWGVSLESIRKEFGETYEAYLLQQADPYLKKHLLFLDADHLYTSKSGKFLADGIASDLFMLNLK